jgi:flagellar biosynthesis GTPase FlhF
MADEKTRIVAEVQVGGGAKGDLKAILEEVRALRETWLKVGAGIEGAESGLKDVNAEQAKAGMLANVWKGIWQGVGIGIFNALKKALMGVVDWIASGIDKASEFGDKFTVLEAKGVKGVGAIKAAVIDLADRMGADLLETTDVVLAARTPWSDLGTAIETASVAMKNYQVNGADAIETIESSRAIVRGFQLDWKRQAEVIAEVASASRRLKIDQGELYGAMERMAPTARYLNITWEQMLSVTEAGLSRGIRSMRMGLMGLGEALEAVANPSEDLWKALVELEILSTPSSGGFLRQTAALESMKREAVALNAELRELERLAGNMAAATNEAQRRADRYRELVAQQESGQRLNRLERAELRELKRELKEYNKELSEYDRQARFVADLDFKRLPVVEQLTRRIANMGRVQGDLAEKITAEKRAGEELTQEIDARTVALQDLAEVLKTEIPAAMQTAISEQGLGGLLATLASSSEAMGQFSANAQAFLAAVQGAGAGSEVSVRQNAIAVAQLGQEWDALENANVNAYQKMKERWGNFTTVVLQPFANLRDELATQVTAWMEDEGVMEKGRAWAEKMSRRIGEDVKAGMSGSTTWSEIISGWIEETAADLKPFVVDVGSELAVEFADAFALMLGAMIDKVMRKIASQIGSALDLSSWLFQPLTNAMWLPQVGGGAGSITDMPFEPMPMGGGGQSNVFNIQGEADPVRVAKEVGKVLEQQARLGVSGGRLGY